MEGHVKALATEEIQMEDKQLEDREAAEEVQLLLELRAMHQQAVNKAKTRRT